MVNTEKLSFLLTDGPETIIILHNNATGHPNLIGKQLFAAGAEICKVLEPYETE